MNRDLANRLPSDWHHRSAFAAALIAAVAMGCSTPALRADSAPRAAVVLQPGDGQSLGLGTGSVRMLSRSADTEGRISQLVLTEKPGYETPLHIHHDMDESFLVLKGRLTVRIRDQLLHLEPGAFLNIPRGTPHGQANQGTEVVEVLLSFSPAGFERFFDERAELVRDHPPGSPEYGPRMRALSVKYQMENVDFDAFAGSAPAAAEAPGPD